MKSTTKTSTTTNNKSAANNSYNSDLDLDSLGVIDDILNSQVSLDPGSYSVRITSYEVIPAITDLYTKEIIRQTYLLIHTNNDLIDIRLYPKRINYFSRCINRQFNYTLSSNTTREILDFLTTHDFTVQLSYHPTYGCQYDFKPTYLQEYLDEFDLN